jgi:hypothetical protein
MDYELGSPTATGAIGKPQVACRWARHWHTAPHTEGVPRPRNAVEPKPAVKSTPASSGTGSMSESVSILTLSEFQKIGTVTTSYYRRRPRSR